MFHYVYSFSKKFVFFILGHLAVFLEIFAFVPAHPADRSNGRIHEALHGG
jgi:hypothetical protein